MLAEMTKSIFQAGFNWDVIRQRWQAFEDAFWQFDITRCANMSIGDIQQLSNNEHIVKNRAKIESVQKNANMILNVSKHHSSFASMIAYWEEDDFINLLAYLQTHGARLGTKTAQFFLRHIGKDGFLLGEDGIRALKHFGIIKNAPATKTEMQTVQNVFNHWNKETSYGLAKVSAILALSIDNS
ncbi:DNA-3-methyladenine glycosylase I [Agaribacter marinus]|uniref:DNA-3-methyladenine glycosylase I n=1 Tax=Agaribacter marinus TaxID=1431249 RepID=A0AA37SVQ4_9ALTE|nr:DNA-3-methyladenine glycosylase I [Agaribacter marinus]GLR70257.1 hypothetical protein GCM10007852_11650 [Agaribacter marinus]